MAAAGLTAVKMKKLLLLLLKTKNINRKSVYI
jgi:hypothetical protein